MNRIMFYNKLDKYHLAHATDEWGKQYYNKLDNYYSNGKARYFYTKEEWDAYQREQQGKAQDNFKKQQEAKKKISTTGNAKTSEPVVSLVWKDEPKTEPSKKFAPVQEEIINEMEQPQFKLSQKDIDKITKDAIDKTIGDMTMKTYEREKNIKKNQGNNPEAGRWKNTDERIKRDKQIQEAQKRVAEKEHPDTRSAEGKRIDELEDELVKLNGKRNLAKNRGRGLLEKDNLNEFKQLTEEIQKKEKEVENLRKELSEKTVSGREASINKSRDTFRELVKKQEREELARKNQEAQEASMKKSQDLAREESAKREAVNNYKEKSSTELDQQNTAINNLLDQCYNKRNVPFNIDNELVEELKTQIALKDPEFVTRWNSDIGKYVQPWVDSNIMFWDGDKDDEHYKIAKETLNEISTKYKNAIDNTKYDDIPENNQTYLEKKKEDYDRKVESDIGQDIAKAKLSLIKVHQGDSKNFEINPSLKKILENKLERIDDKYDGDLYDYIKPYFGLSFLPDNASYQNIEDILDEMEEELKSGKNPYGIYTEYYNNIRNAVYNA